MNPLRPIEDFLTWALEGLHSTVGLPWAWAIVVLTILVRMVICADIKRSGREAAQQHARSEGDPAEIQGDEEDEEEA